MKVKRSCNLAFFVNKIFDPKYAMRPMAATAVKDVADVCVNSCGAVDSSSIVKVVVMFVGDKTK